MTYERTRDESYTISTARKRLDLAVVHGFLTSCYWAKGVPLETVKRSLEHSLPFGLYCGLEQVGFARVITDYATFAYLADVFVLESHRGKGLGKWLVETILAHPELQDLRRFALMTRDAQELYARFGFKPVGDVPTFMQRWDPEVYMRREQRAAAAVSAPRR